MFEKEAEEWTVDYICKDCSRYEKCKSKEHCTCKECSKDKWQNGAKFGYNKAKVEAEEEKCELLGIIQDKDKAIQELKKEIAELKKKHNSDEKCLKRLAKKGYIKFSVKSNEWHFVKDGDLPNTETKNYTYIRRRKRYERQFTDYRVIKCFVLCLNEKGKTTAEVGYFDCNQKCFLDKAEGMVYAWKEIVLPKEI